MYIKYIYLYLVLWSINVNLMNKLGFNLYITALVVTAS